MSNLTIQNIDDIAWDKSGNGLTPCVVQDVTSKKVLMLGYMNKSALEKTFKTNNVTFFSRKTQALWTKGETSGNFLNLISAELDCDNDTILIQALPVGAVCHTGDNNCFNDDSSYGIAFLNKLMDVIKTRKNDNPDESYTASLFKDGLSRMCQKVGEEGVEVALAGMKSDKEELLNESADLMFHLMILLENFDLSLLDSVRILENRHKSTNS